MQFSLDNWQAKASQRLKAYKYFLAHLRIKKVKQWEETLESCHEEAFQCIDCTACAACCKTISPRFKTPDIRKISKFLKIKESDLIESYLRLDEDGDYVVKRSPCPFLGKDNLCGIYEVRPGDCKNYPYTDQLDFIKRPQTTLNNAVICPAVYYVLEKLQDVHP